MRKILLFCICISLTFSSSGCSPDLEKILQRYLYTEEETESVSLPQERVYMDEITGILTAFHENELTLKSEDISYTFDVSQATLECSNGMIIGSELSVIYEGQLSDTDTSTVNALKVVDTFHEAVSLEEKTTKGIVQRLTANTIQIKTKTKKPRVLIFPITGVTQYYKNGLKAGSTVYLHYKGTLPKRAADNSAVYAGHVKVLSISDTEPLKLPTKAQANQEEAEKQMKHFSATLKNVNLNLLHLSLPSTDKSIDLDLSNITGYFKDGLAPDSTVIVYYTGEFDGESLNGISIQKVIGRNSANLSERKITSTVSGTITGITSNTVTLLTNDGATIICYYNDVPNSASSMEPGWGIKVIFNPSLSRTSTIYQALKIENAGS